MPDNRERNCYKCGTQLKGKWWIQILNRIYCKECSLTLKIKRV